MAGAQIGEFEVGKARQRAEKRFGDVDLGDITGLSAEAVDIRRQQAETNILLEELNRAFEFTGSNKAVRAPVEAEILRQKSALTEIGQRLSAAGGTQKQLASVRESFKTPGGVAENIAGGRLQRLAAGTGGARRSLLGSQPLTARASLLGG
jgi:hypothetical protein